MASEPRSVVSRGDAKPEAASRAAEASTLGDELRRIREARGLSLRAVEAAIGISNAYLSQVETGKIDKPNPNYLFKLAELYRIPYEMLMEKAGYIMRAAGKKGRSAGAPRRAQNLSGAALSTMEDLTPEEAEELMRFLAFIRSRRGSRT